MSSRNLSVWFADDDPSRSEIASGVLALFLSVFALSATDATISWVWLTVGFVVWAIALGPVAASSAGKRFGAWFKRIGVAGRAVAILVAAAVIWIVGTQVGIPVTPVQNFVSGGFVAIFVFVAVEAIRTRVIPN